MTKQFTPDLKLKAVDYYHKINNYVKVCEVFECSERSLKRWVERYDKNKNVNRKTRKLGSYKLEKQHIQFIKETLRKHSDIQMNFLHELLKAKFPKLDISRQYLSDIIRDNNITRKRATFKHFPKTYRGNVRNEQKELKDFFDVINKFKLEDIISIDETSVSTSLTHNYCRAFLGERCVKKTTNNEVFKKYTGIFAISSKGVIGYEVYKKGGIDSNRMVDFINKFINGKHKNKLIILDNASSHRNQLVKDVIKKDNNLLYAVPYQHYTNAIEGYFNVLKSRLQKKKGLTYDELVNNVKDVLDEIPIHIYKNLIKGAYDRSEKYVKKTINEKKET